MIKNQSKGHKLFVPTNPDKYCGKIKKVVVRSSWEFTFCKWCDCNPRILKWASEEVEIPYFDPTSNKRRRYYPDFFIIVDVGLEEPEKFLIEVKPFKETRPPRNRKGKKTTTLLKEKKTYIVNSNKWKAAQSYCKRRGWKFRIITEKELYLK